MLLKIELYLTAVILLGLCTAGPVQATEVEDRQLLAFWERRAATASDPAASIEICRKEMANQPNSMYLPVIRGVMAWHELAAGRTEEGAATLKTLLTSQKDPLSAAANTLACRWLTRLDRERVRVALSAYYTRHVAYPASLSPILALPEGQRPPALDRWDQPWQYRLASFKRIPGLSDQRYDLRSGALDSESDLKTSLAIPYVAPTNLIPVKVISRTEGPAAVEFQDAATPPRRMVLTEGTRSGRFYFVRLVAQSVLLTDGDRWYLVPLP